VFLLRYFLLIIRGLFLSFFLFWGACATPKEKERKKQASKVQALALRAALALLASPANFNKLIIIYK